MDRKNILMTLSKTNLTNDELVFHWDVYAKDMAEGINHENNQNSPRNLDEYFDYLLDVTPNDDFKRSLAVYGDKFTL